MGLNGQLTHSPLSKYYGSYLKCKILTSKLTKYQPPTVSRTATVVSAKEQHTSGGLRLIHSFALLIDILKNLTHLFCVAVFYNKEDKESVQVYSLLYRSQFSIILDRNYELEFGPFFLPNVGTTLTNRLLY